MAFSQRLSFAIIFVAAAVALLNFSPLQIDARATPGNHFSIASLTSTISAVPSLSPSPFPDPSLSPVPAPAPAQALSPFPEAIARSTGGRGYGLYSRESSVTADELSTIESQLDKVNDEPKSTTTTIPSAATQKTYETNSYATNGVGNGEALSTAYRGRYANGEKTPVTSTATTELHRFGKTYSQEESDLDGHNKAKEYYGQFDAPTDQQSFNYGTNYYNPGSYRSNEYGNRQQTSSQSTSTPVASTKAQTYSFGDDVKSNTEFGSKLHESSTQSTAIPNSFYGSNNYYNGNTNADTNTNRYYGMSDTRKAENQQLFYNAAKGLGTTSKAINVNNEQTANYRYNNAANKVSGTTYTGGNNYRTGYNSNRQSQNEFSTMEEYYRSQGIQP